MVDVVVVVKCSSCRHREVGTDSSLIIDVGRLLWWISQIVLHCSASVIKLKGAPGSRVAQKNNNNNNDIVQQH
jgi:hypothetical protein